MAIRTALFFGALFLWSGWMAPGVRAAEQNYLTPVFPVRDPQYWRQGSDPAHFSRLYDLVKQTGLASTWLVHYDILENAAITSALKSLPGAETGLFLEVTRKLAQDSFVRYDWEHCVWSCANRVFLSGYPLTDRQRLIDRAFSSFKEKFGQYPSAYGAWYIDVWSAEYIRDKYGARVMLGLSDQYSTDGYQTWGQYLNLPYFMSKRSAIEPAADTADSTGILKLQWAPREPALGLGLNVDSSNYSAQVNDYYRGKGLGPDYFRTLLADLTVNVPGQVSQAVVGIEVGELEPEYFSGLTDQLQAVSALAAAGQAKVVTMTDFYEAYSAKYPAVSPPGIIGSSAIAEPVWWYFDARYRLGVKIANDGAQIVDLRFYHQSDYRDNDQTETDPRPNLVRLVPAVIDTVTLNNFRRLGDRPAGVKVSADQLRVSSADGELIASPGGITTTYTGVDTGLFNPPVLISVEKKLCHNEYGSFAGRFPCVKAVLVWLARLIPDLVVSRLEGRIHIGLRTGFESFIGLRFPDLKLGKFVFAYEVLDNFLSLRQKLTPDFAWQGKQEIEVASHQSAGEIFAKGHDYGQDRLLIQPARRKIYENSYYAVFAP